MSVFEELCETTTIREKIGKVRGKDVLFIEAPMLEHDAARDKYLKYKAVEKAEKGKDASHTRELTFDSETSKTTKYNRTLVMMTAHEPDTREKIFKDIAAFNKMFAAVNGVHRHGDSLFNEFLVHAQSIIQSESVAGAEKN